MKAILLCAGRGVRFRPVTESIPKPLLPYLNVPLASVHLRRLQQAGVGEVAVNLHHLGDQIERHLSGQATQLPQLTFFPEPQILGTAGALRNAAPFLSGGDFFLVNSDAAISPDFAGLAAHHRRTGRAATLLVTENRNPQQYTPLQAEGDRITTFGFDGPRPLLYTGVCVLSPRLLPRIPAGETALVTHLWQPLLDEGREEIGFLLHRGGRLPISAARAISSTRRSKRSIAEDAFPEGGGQFDGRLRVLSREPTSGFEASTSVLGRARIEAGASIHRSAVWDDVVIEAGARLTECLVARGRVPAGAHYEKALLWADTAGEVAAWPLSGFDGNDHRVQPFSPRR